MTTLEGHMAPPNANSADAALEKKDIFPFFGLQRELRDKIYADITVDAWVRMTRDHSCEDEVTTYQCASFQSAPSTRHSAINRQFRREYLEEMARPSTGAMLIVDLNLVRDLCGRVRPALRRALSRVHTVIWTHMWDKVIHHQGEIKFTSAPYPLNLR